MGTNNCPVIHERHLLALAESLILTEIQTLQGYRYMAEPEKLRLMAEDVVDYVYKSLHREFGPVLNEKYFWIVATPEQKEAFWNSLKLTSNKGVRLDGFNIRWSWAAGSIAWDDYDIFRREPAIEEPEEFNEKITLYPMVRRGEPDFNKALSCFYLSTVAKD